MRYVILSFDDGRRDFFTNALPVLRKYQLKATLNVVSDFVGHAGLSVFDSGNGECLSWEEIRICHDYGIEIANHSADHTNELPQILRGAQTIAREVGLTAPIGFASPSSDIFPGNFHAYRPLLENGDISYLRSGNQIKRDGYGYAALYFLYRFTGSAQLYCRYNRRNLIPLGSPCPLLPSVTCNADNNAKQMLRFVQTIPDNTAVILMFHSILKETDPGYSKDKWYNTVEDFKALCAELSQNQSLKVITTAELTRLLK